MLRHLLGFFLILVPQALLLKGADISSFTPNETTRIIALNPSTYEILEDLGEASHIIGADVATHMELPEAESKKLANFGHPYHPNLEAIIALKPDIVVSTADSLPDPAPAQLREAGLRVLLLEASAQDGIEGLKRRVAAVAKAFGKEAEGRAIIQKIDTRMMAIEAANAKVTQKKNVFFLYTHGPGRAFIYGRDTGSHWLIELAGAHNAADFTSGTKPLTPEALVRAAPDALILLDRGIKAMGGLDGVFTIQGVMLTPAGKAHAIINVDNSIRWIGTRFLDHVEKLHRELYPDAS